MRIARVIVAVVDHFHGILMLGALHPVRKSGSTRLRFIFNTAPHSIPQRGGSAMRPHCRQRHGSSREAALTCTVGTPKKLFVSSVIVLCEVVETLGDMNRSCLERDSPPRQSCSLQACQGLHQHGRDLQKDRCPLCQCRLCHWCRCPLFSSGLDTSLPCAEETTDDIAISRCFVHVSQSSSALSFGRLIRFVVIELLIGKWTVSIRTRRIELVVYIVDNADHPAAILRCKSWRKRPCTAYRTKCRRGEKHSVQKHDCCRLINSRYRHVSSCVLQRLRVSDRKTLVHITKNVLIMQRHIE